MKLFRCEGCGQALMFENTDCERCGRKLGYLPDRRILSAIQPEGRNWVAVPEQRYRFCANWEQQAAIGWSGLTPGTNFVLLAATIGTHPQPFRPVESCPLQN